MENADQPHRNDGSDSPGRPAPDIASGRKYEGALPLQGDSVKRLRSPGPTPLATLNTDEAN